jgi:plasmid replication initiation protein
MTKQWEDFSQNIDKNPLRVFVLHKVIRGKTMKKLFARLFGWGDQRPVQEQEVIFQTASPQEIEYKSMVVAEETSVTAKVKKTYRKQPKKQENPRGKKTKDGDIIVHDPRDIRDVMELMEVPFVALSKNRTAPIIYESPDGKSKVKISCHPPYYLASIYDWDIILFVASKLQEIINSGQDIPPRTLIVPRHELFKAINKHAGKTTGNEIEASLSRLRSTLIETTIQNEDYRYKGGFGFLDSWGYTERKDVKEFRITLSEWLYALTCRKGSLLKVHPEYFKITSGIKRFLYRTARKHVGTQNSTWDFTIEKLYEKSGSEQELRKFKHDLRKSVQDNDIYGYLLEWIEEDGKTFVRFINMRKLVKESLSSPSHKPPT